MGFPGGLNSKESTCNARDMGREDPVEEGMATYSSILVWRIPGTEEPGSPWGPKESTRLKWLSAHAQAMKNETYNFCDCTYELHSYLKLALCNINTNGKIQANNLNLKIFLLTWQVERENRRKENLLTLVSLMTTFSPAFCKGAPLFHLSRVLPTMYPAVNWPHFYS